MYLYLTSIFLIIFPYSSHFCSFILASSFSNPPFLPSFISVLPLFLSHSHPSLIPFLPTALLSFRSLLPFSSSCFVHFLHSFLFFRFIFFLFLFCPSFLCYQLTGVFLLWCIFPHRLKQKINQSMNQINQLNNNNFKKFHKCPQTVQNHFFRNCRVNTSWPIKYV